MSHSAEEDMTLLSTCCLGVVTASPHPYSYSREWHRLRALRFPRQHPLHWLRALHVRPSANRSAAFCCSLHVRVVDCSHGDRFGKSVAEATKLSLHISEASRRDASCLPCQQPAPRPQTLCKVWVRCLCFSGPQESNIHPPRRGPGTAAHSSYPPALAKAQGTPGT